MKKSSVILLAAVVVVGLFGLMGAQAHCGNDSGNNAHDPFGSCENQGDVRCAGDATDVGGLFTVDVAASGGNGAQICNEGDTLPYPTGRAGVYRDNAGNVIVHVDGDRDQVGSAGMTRVDVKPGAASNKVCIRRGQSGSYYTSGGGMEDDSVLKQCAA